MLDNYWRFLGEIERALVWWTETLQKQATRQTVDPRLTRELAETKRMLAKVEQYAQELRSHIENVGRAATWTTHEAELVGRRFRDFWEEINSFCYTPFVELSIRAKMSNLADDAKFDLASYIESLRQRTRVSEDLKRKAQQELREALFNLGMQAAEVSDYEKIRRALKAKYADLGPEALNDIETHVSKAIKQLESDRR
jgi:hypothetical protein